MDVIKLIEKLAKFEAAAKSRAPNVHPKPVARPALPLELRLTQAELVGAFGVKKPAALPRKTRVAIVVCARVHRGVDSYGTIAGKAETLIKRLSTHHGIVPVTASRSAATFADSGEPDSETDSERFTRLAAQSERRELLAECAEIQPQCWKLACTLDKREECPMLPSGFKSLGLEELRALHKRLVTTRTNWSLRLEEIRRAEENARKAEEARRAALAPLYKEAQLELARVEFLIQEKRVRVERITLPPLATLDAPKLEDIIKKLKSFKVRIEARARELDPRRNGHRVFNPSALRSPLAA